MVAATVGEVGADIGVWDLNDGRPGLLLSPDETKVGQGTLLTSPECTCCVLSLASG